MNVSHLMVAKGFGGAERWFIDLASAMARAGHRVQAIHHTRFGHVYLLEGQAQLSRAAVTVRGHWDLFARHQIGRLLAQFQPAVLHVHLARGAHLGGALGRRLGVPVVATLHNYVDLKYYRQVDHFIATTTDQQTYLIQHGLPPAAISLIPHFTPLAAQVARVRERPIPVLLAYGRMVEKKGFDVLLRAYARLRATGARARLIIAGDGPERRALETLATTLAITADVSFPGWIDDIPRALAGADVFVLPSLLEPFGIAVLEAMAMAIPIVATTTAGPREILDDASAWLIAPGDVGALATALAAAVADPGGAFARAQRASSRLQQFYSEASVIPQYEQLYARLLKR